jgi:predicted nucleic acid-binding Zn ribbon protein
MPESDAPSEAARVYLHFREVFGAAPARLARRKRAADAEHTSAFGSGRDPHAIGEAIDTLAAEFGWTSPLAQHELLASWAELAGEETARHSTPESIDAGLLTVRCDSTAWATQLRLIRSDIVTRIAQRFPDAGIQSVRFLGPDAPSWKKGPRSVPGRGPRDTYG